VDVVAAFLKNIGKPLSDGAEPGKTDVDDLFV
jgi:hypothetical protein